jgi:hypothetical protein
MLLWDFVQILICLICITIKTSALCLDPVHHFVFLSLYLAGEIDSYQIHFKFCLQKLYLCISHSSSEWSEKVDQYWKLDPRLLKKGGGGVLSKVTISWPGLALGGVGLNAVLCKTCSVLLCVLDRDWFFQLFNWFQLFLCEQKMQ